jgi:hypothetical protein
MKKRKVNLTKDEVAFALKKGEYWDTHSVADVWDKTKPVKMEVAIEDSFIVIPVTSRLAKQLDKLVSKKKQSVEEWLSRAVEKELAAASH